MKARQSIVAALCAGLAFVAPTPAVAQAGSYVHLTCDFRQTPERRTADGYYTSTPARTDTYRIGNGEWSWLDSTGTWTNMCRPNVECVFGQSAYRVGWVNPESQDVRQYMLEINRVTGEAKANVWYRTGDAYDQYGQCRVVPPPAPPERRLF